MSLKRINNEVTRIFPASMKKYGLKYSLCYVDSETTPNALVICNDYGNIVLRINCGDSYPFKPPNIFVNTKPNLLSFDRNENFMSYSHWARDIINPRKKDINYINSLAFITIRYPHLKCLRNINPHNNFHSVCLCCKSSTCSGNWYPGIKIDDIFIEYFMHRNFIALNSKLLQRYIKPIFDNDRWTLPDDVIMYIVSNFI